MRQAVLLMLTLFLASCVSAPSTKRGRMEADVREAVFRHQFAQWKRPGATAYFLDVTGENGDPDDEFLRRFAGCRTPVKKYSQGKMHDLGESVADGETGGSGVIFRAGSITWISDWEARVSGGFYENSRSASGNIYTVRFAQGRWRVVEDKEVWMARAEYLELNRGLCSI